MSSEEGYYLYGIVAANRQQDFGSIGIGGRGDTVYTIVYKDIAVIISKSPMVKYQVNRDNIFAHTHTIETVAKEHTVLPIRFCTFAKNEEMIVNKLLKARYQEFVHLSKEMHGKIELGLRARWKNMDAIFAEMLEENKTIRRLKENSLREKNIQKKYADSIRIGEMVQAALEKKRLRETRILREAVKPLSLDSKESKLYGDMNLLNGVFLVDKAKEEEFDKRVNDLQKAYEERTLLIYTSSPVPYSFVELIVTW